MMNLTMIVRSVVIFSSVLLLVVGGGLVFFPLWIQTVLLQPYALYFPGGAESLLTPVLTLVGVGASVVLLAILEMVGAHRLSARLLTFCALFGLAVMAGVVTVMVITQSTGAVYREHAARDDTGRRAMKHYGRVKWQGKTNAMDVYQTELGCCGIRSWLDWRNESIVHKNWVEEIIQDKQTSIAPGKPARKDIKGEQEVVKPLFPASCCRDQNIVNRTCADPQRTEVNHSVKKANGTHFTSMIFEEGCGTKFSRVYGLAVDWIMIASEVSIGLLIWTYLLTLVLCREAYRGRRKPLN